MEGRMYKLKLIILFWFLNAHTHNPLALVHHPDASQSQLSNMSGLPITGEHISQHFYDALRNTNRAKTKMQNYLLNFLENLQKNISTSPILNSAHHHNKTYLNQLHKLNYLCEYFLNCSDIITTFIYEVKSCFEAVQYESHSLLQKFREIPAVRPHSLHPYSKDIKTDLRAYIIEAEYFHTTFKDIVDGILDYIVYTLNSIRGTLKVYSDIQKELLVTGNLISSEWCHSNYMNFMKKWSARIFKCCSNTNLLKVYDTYAITELNTIYIMQQLEFRIQNLYNCYMVNGFQLRCKFLQYPEKDFATLFNNLNELQQYADMAFNTDRFTKYRMERYPRKREIDNCIPQNFPLQQMSPNLRNCFNFSAMIL